MKRRFLLLACVITLLFSAHAHASGVIVSYAPDTSGVLNNPYMGLVAWAGDDETYPQPFSLVYANLRWADFEQEEGAFDFEAFELENHFERWRAEGKRLILRFVLDVPGKKKHLDIPEWLYKKTGDGTYYRTSYGRGYTPNYENAILIAAHTRAIEALGGRYGRDPFVAFVQLGSLGHWGEWHIHDDIGDLPADAVRQRYVLPYLTAFPNAFLMARRPFSFAVKARMGLFNDASGNPAQTEEWLAWIEKGGWYQNEEGALSPMPLGWQAAPIGGELASGMTLEELLGDGLAETLRLFEASHTSWIGPHSFVDVEANGKWQPALDSLLKKIGYRLRVERAGLSQNGDGTRTLTLRWQNDGIAPFYFDWPARLRLTCRSGRISEMDLPLRLMDILPGRSYDVSVTLPAGAYDVELGIVDPATGLAGVSLAMHVPQSQLWHLLLTVE